jgi:glucose-1-phosphate cytidylyltransferase
MKNNSMKVHQKRAEPWTITLVDTGDNSMTGGRLGRVAEYVKNEEAFCFTYGDGVSNVDITKLIEFHKEHGKDATLTSVYPPGRFGALDIQDNQVIQFTEKPKGDGALINGGFFVLSPKVLERISGDDCTWEQGPLKGLASDDNLMAFTHDGFWQPMDTLRDKVYLQELWEESKAPWKTW